ncbi:MAG: hypothetical protein KAJ40_05705 [Alphaproteobacteria bacterium]|nr:hypothetical protein [Alphaproteobacteria bacterium]
MSMTNALEEKIKSLEATIRNSTEFSEGMKYAKSSIKSIYCTGCGKRFWVDKQEPIVGLSKAGVHKCPFCSRDDSISEDTDAVVK